MDIKEAIADAIEVISKYVLPLYVEHRSRQMLIGSGFFVETRNKLALVTAAHVLNRISNANPLFVYRRPNELVQITGKRFLSHPEGIDLGFILTSNFQLPWVDVSKFACRIEYLHAQRTPRSERLYVIAGYPETKNRLNPKNQTIKATIHAYYAHSIPDHEYQQYGLDPNIHVAFPLDRKRGFDASGRLVNFPKPQGMSGSPIWELFDESEYAHPPRTFPLVAVGTTYKNKILYGTDVGHLLSKLLVAV